MRLASRGVCAPVALLLQLLSGALFNQDDPTHQELVACCVYRLVGQALQADAKLDGCVRRLGARSTLRRKEVREMPADSGARTGRKEGPTPQANADTPVVFAGARRPLYRALVDRAMLCVKRTGGGGLAFSPLPPQDPALRHDHLGSVLALLATGEPFFTSLLLVAFPWPWRAHCCVPVCWLQLLG